MLDGGSDTTSSRGLCASLSIVTFDHKTASNALPKNGVYFFFERGEFVCSDSSVLDRIVRIGTHRETNRFRGRIRQHYGPVSSLSGNKNSSVFRKHLGGTLLNKADPEDPRIKAWLMQDGPAFNEIEELVSRELRERFTFACLRIDNPQDRKDLERGLIALLARYPLDQPTPKWLGRYALAPEIRQYGLWNTQHTDSEPLTSSEFRLLERLAATTLDPAE